MSDTLNSWFTGKHVFSIIATPQSAAASGALTPGTARTFSAIVDEISYNGRSVTEEIAAITSPFENNVIVEQDDSIVVREILRTSTDGTGQLLALMTMLANHDFISWEIKRGYTNPTVGGQVATITFWGVMMSYTETLRKGKCVAEMTIAMIDQVGTANPTYAMALSG